MAASFSYGVLDTVLLMIDGHPSFSCVSKNEKELEKDDRMIS